MLGGQSGVRRGSRKRARTTAVEEAELEAAIAASLTTADSAPSSARPSASASSKTKAPKKKVKRRRRNKEELERKRAAEEAERRKRQRLIDEQLVSIEQVVVFQFGSSSLRFGRASHLTAKSVPQVVAYRRSRSRSNLVADADASGAKGTSESGEEGTKTEDTHERKQQGEGVNSTSSPTRDDEREEPIRIDHFTAAARRVIRKNQELLAAIRGPSFRKFKDKHSETKADDFEANPTLDPLRSGPWPKSAYFGQDALDLPFEAHFERFWPMRDGRMNFETCTLEQSCERLADICAYALSEPSPRGLAIGASEFSSLHAVLVLPDTFGTWQVSSLISAMFRVLGVAAVMIHRESVCSAFGAGMSTACVVDIGAQKTGVCCVEDGRILPETIRQLPIGGDDITRLLAQLLCSSFNANHFPLEDPNRFELSHEQWWRIVESVKRTSCHIEAEVIAPSECTFTIPQTSRTDPRAIRCEVTLRDPLLLAPMGLFTPVCFPVPPNGKRKKIKKSPFPTHQHPFDNRVLSTDTVADDVGDDAAKNRKTATKQKSIVRVGLGLEEAIVDSLRSVEKASSEVKLASSILLCGGGSQILALRPVLEQRIKLMETGRHITVIPGSPNVEVSQLAWRGGKILCRVLETKECWLSREQYERGVWWEALARNAPFVWPVDDLW